MAGKVMQQKLTQSERCLAFVTAFDRGEGLYELASGRAKSMIDFGASQRVIDVVLSNIRNSGIIKAVVACQFGAPALIKHLRQPWAWQDSHGLMLDLLPPDNSEKGGAGYGGNASALFQNIDVIDDAGVDHVLVVAGEHVCKMDYSLLLQDHIASGRPVTSVHIDRDPKDSADEHGQQPKPSNAIVQLFPARKARKRQVTFQAEVTPDMNIYVFDWPVLRLFLRAVAETGRPLRTIEGDILPAMSLAGFIAHQHSFSRSCVRAPGAEPECTTLSTLDAFWHAHMDLLEVDDRLFDQRNEWPIGGLPDFQVSTARFLPGSSGAPCEIGDSIIGNGCQILGASISGSVLGTGVWVGSGAKISHSVLQPDVRVGSEVTLEKTIVKRGTVLPKGLSVGLDRRQDQTWFRVTPGGITLVSQEMVQRRTRLLAG
jgi:glucose-1-phosphate adenylyltransferase